MRGRTDSRVAWGPTSSVSRGPDFSACAGTGASAGHSSSSVRRRAAPRTAARRRSAGLPQRLPVDPERFQDLAVGAGRQAGFGQRLRDDRREPRRIDQQHGRRAPVGPPAGVQERRPARRRCPATPGRPRPSGRRRRPHPPCAARRRRRWVRRTAGGARPARTAATRRPAGGPTRTARAAGRPAQTGGRAAAISAWGRSRAPTGPSNVSVASVVSSWRRRPLPSRGSPPRRCADRTGACDRNTRSEAADPSHVTTVPAIRMPAR